MPKFLPVNNRSPLSIAVCARCNTKIPYAELREDGNSPGLLVCQSPGCFDHFDPWRLPARKTEDITLRHPRPDTDLSIAAADVVPVDAPLHE